MSVETASASSRPATRTDGLRRLYSGAAVMLLNLVLLLVVFNSLLWVAFAVLDSVRARSSSQGSPSNGSSESAAFGASGEPLPGPNRSQYQLDWFDLNAYGTAADAAHASEVLDDFYSLAELGFVYQPWTEFSEPAFSGKRVHVDVDERGFPHRRTVEPTAVGPQPVRHVFAMGGSTTFGYNVADGHTWPSFLSQALNRRVREAQLGFRISVTNWGRAYFNPSQELALFHDLLRSGHRPDIAIFMDGVNLGPAEDVPHFSRQVAEGFRKLQFGTAPSTTVRLEWLPMARLASAIRPKSGADAGSAHTQAERKVEHLVARFVWSWRQADTLCQMYRIQCLFFLQPDPVLNYPIELYRRVLPASFLAEREERAAFRRRLGRPEGVIDLSGLFGTWGAGRKAIIDDVHYSPGFNRVVADAVAAHIDVVGLAGELSALTAAVPTGAPRSSLDQTRFRP